MALPFVGIDPNTGTDESPTVWVDEDKQELVFQGWKPGGDLVVEIGSTQWAPGHSTGIPDSENVTRIPMRMIPIIRKACDEAERSQLR